jgi:hypothetical protein
MVNNGMTFEFGNTDASIAFLKRNSTFVSRFNRLLDLSNKCFGRAPRLKNRTEHICFGLGHTSREDFLEIVFLAANGYSNAALKLLRGLFERALTMAYIIKSPKKADRFMNFAAIQEHRGMTAALELVSEADFDKAMGPDNSAGEMRKRFKAIKRQFSKTVSWDQGIASMTKDLGKPYTTMYLQCYAIPNFSIHATLASAARWEGNENSDTEADFVAFNAVWILIAVMDSQDKLFGLGLGPETESIWQELMDEYVKK